MYNPTTEDQLTKGTYIEATKNALKTEKQNNKNQYYNNLNTGEGTAIKELEDQNDIIITKAGKGGTVVIIDVEDYAKEAEHQLKNKTEMPLFYT